MALLLKPKEANQRIYISPGYTKIDKRQITKANKNYGNHFAPKYRAFSILQNKIEDVVEKSTQMWKLTYGLTTVKEREEYPFEGRNNEEEDEDKEE